jgi:hypothetical protein
VGYPKQKSVVDIDVIQGENFPGLERTNVKYLINGGTLTFFAVTSGTVQKYYMENG